MKVLAMGVIGLIGISSFAAEAFPPLFPFLISYDAPDNAVSMAHLLDAPAGKHGFVRVQDGRFVTDKGRIRFHATNLTGPANFPTHAQADETADRLARFGINILRDAVIPLRSINIMPMGGEQGELPLIGYLL